MEFWRAAEGAIAAGHGRRQGPMAAAARSMEDLQLGADVACWRGVPSAPAGWRPADHSLQDSRAVLLAAWARREAREVAGRRADFAHVSEGMDRWATRRLQIRRARSQLRSAFRSIPSRTFTSRYCLVGLALSRVAS